MLEQLANSMRDEAAPGGSNPSAPVHDGDNNTIPTGYSYLGQFIDHDFILDPVSCLAPLDDPDALELRDQVIGDPRPGEVRLAFEVAKHSCLNVDETWAPERFSDGGTCRMPDLIRGALGN